MKKALLGEYYGIALFENSFHDEIGEKKQKLVLVEKKTCDLILKRFNIYVSKKEIDINIQKGIDEGLCNIKFEYKALCQKMLLLVKPYVSAYKEAFFDNKDSKEHFIYYHEKALYDFFEAEINDKDGLIYLNNYLKSIE